jgi:hypothetical protein
VSHLGNSVPNSKTRNAMNSMNIPYIPREVVKCQKSPATKIIRRDTSPDRKHMNSDQIRSDEYIQLFPTSTCASFPAIQILMGLMRPKSAAQNPSSQDARSRLVSFAFICQSQSEAGLISKELNIHNPKHTPKRLSRLAQRMRAFPIYYSNPVLIVKECLGNLPVNLIPEDAA